jgi:hypothetical protein
VAFVVVWAVAPLITWDGAATGAMDALPGAVEALAGVLCNKSAFPSVANAVAEPDMPMASIRHTYGSSFMHYPLLLRKGAAESAKLTCAALSSAHKTFTSLKSAQKFVMNL